MKAFYERLRARFPLLPVTVAILILGIFTLTRIGLAIYTGFNLVSLSLWPGIILKGLWFDLAVIAVLIAPLCLYEALLPNGWRAHRWHGILRALALWGVTSLLLFIAVAEVIFWDEFFTHFNFYPTISNACGRISALISSPSRHNISPSACAGSFFSVSAVSVIFFARIILISGCPACVPFKK